MLIGQRFSRFAEASEKCLLFSAKTTDFIVDFTPGFVHACLCDSRRTRGAVSPFTMLLRKHIGADHVVDLGLLRPGDRLLGISFSHGARLVLELTGRHANAFLLDANGVILGSLFSTHSLTRPLHPGAVYALPPVVGSSPVAEASRFTPPEVCAAIDAFFTEERLTDARSRARHKALAHVDREITRTQKVLEHLERDHARMLEREEARTLGDLFLAALPFWPKDATSFLLEPADGSAPVELVLPARCKTPSAAAQLHFAAYKKARRSREVIRERSETFGARLQELESQRRKLEELPLESFDADLSRTPQTSRTREKHGKKSASEDTRGLREYQSSDGLRILVGKSAADNHRLTFRLARGRDIWLHARDVPGSHVVLFTRNQPVPRRALEEAAMLAIFYSDARAEGRGDVHWVERRHVHAVRGAIGKVTLSSPKSLHVVVDPAVLERFRSSR